MRGNRGFATAKERDAAINAAKRQQLEPLNRQLSLGRVVGMCCLHCHKEVHRAFCDEKCLDEFTAVRLADIGTAISSHRFLLENGNETGRVRGGVEAARSAESSSARDAA